MTGSELLAAVPGVLTAIGGLLVIWVRDRGRVAETQKDLQSWAQGIVHEAVESERATYSKTISILQTEIAEARAESAENKSEIAELKRAIKQRDEVIEEFPELVEKFVLVVASIDREKTPSREQLEALRSFAKRLRLPDHVPNHILLSKVGA